MFCEQCFEDFLKSFIEEAAKCDSSVPNEKETTSPSENDDDVIKKFHIAGIWTDGKEKVSVLFGDNTEETATCHPDDKYDLRRGIEVCMLHRLFGGMEEYNKFMDLIVKQYKKAVERKKEEEAAKELAARREEKRICRQEQRKAKYEEKCKQTATNVAKKQYDPEYINGLISMLESVLATLDE